MILPGRATGRPNFSPFSGRRAEAGARFAMSPSGVRSPLFAASTAPRSPGTFGVDGLQVDHLIALDHAEPQPPSASNPTIFMSASS